MWFIGVEVEQETSAPPPKKKILDPPLVYHAKQYNKTRRSNLVHSLLNQNNILSFVRPLH